jgi:hypothetical protein
MLKDSQSLERLQRSGVRASPQKRLIKLRDWTRRNGMSISTTIWVVCELRLGEEKRDVNIDT